jgi:hypothetical protein
MSRATQSWSSDREVTPCRHRDVNRMPLSLRLARMPAHHCEAKKLHTLT